MKLSFRSKVVWKEQVTLKLLLLCFLTLFVTGAENGIGMWCRSVCVCSCRFADNCVHCI